MKKNLFFLTIFLLTVVASGCGKKQSAADAVAESGSAAPVALPVTFNADSALSYAGKQTGFGPRVPNTEAHRRCGEWLSQTLRSRGASVEEQNVTLTAFDGTPLKARNILARFNPKSEKRILLMAHWDSRPWADQDPDESKRRNPVDGANDGASGTAVLLELARLIQQKAPAVGVDILLLDAEDWGEESNDESWALGAEYFVKHLPEDFNPSAAILLDMVGDADATFCREYFSEQAAPGLATKVRAIAEECGLADRFPDANGSAVMDDHVKFIEAGIPAIDIIDYRQGYNGGFCPTWHTTSDTFENLSAKTLGDVGQVITRLVYTM